MHLVGQTFWTTDFTPRKMEDIGDFCSGLHFKSITLAVTRKIDYKEVRGEVRRLFNTQVSM